MEMGPCAWATAGAAIAAAAATADPFKNLRRDRDTGSVIDIKPPKAATSLLARLPLRIQHENRILGKTHCCGIAGGRVIAHKIKELTPV
jgi:hypothetical protein